jgi:hypothetical protein
MQLFERERVTSHNVVFNVNPSDELKTTLLIQRSIRDMPWANLMKPFYGGVDQKADITERITLLCSISSNVTQSIATLSFYNFAYCGQARF